MYSNLEMINVTNLLGDEHDQEQITSLAVSSLPLEDLSNPYPLGHVYLDSS